MKKLYTQTIEKHACGLDVDLTLATLADEGISAEEAGKAILAGMNEKAADGAYAPTTVVWYSQHDPTQAQLHDLCTQYKTVAIFRVPPPEEIDPSADSLTVQEAGRYEAYRLTHTYNRLLEAEHRPIVVVAGGLPELFWYMMDSVSAFLPVYATTTRRVQIPLLDKSGAPVLDERGKPKTTNDFKHVRFRRVWKGIAWPPSPLTK